MDYIFIIIAMIMFFIFKIIDTKIIKKNQINIKHIIKESIFILIILIISLFINSQFKTLFNSELLAPKVFLNDPEF